jgi:hypothetical protein
MGRHSSSMSTDRCVGTTAIDREQALPETSAVVDHTTALAHLDVRLLVTQCLGSQVVLQ